MVIRANNLARIMGLAVEAMVDPTARTSHTSHKVALSTILRRCLSLAMAETRAMRLLAGLAPHVMERTSTVQGMADRAAIATNPLVGARLPIITTSKAHLVGYPL